ncbi:MAG: helix-turn-helix domain-containing protein [Firmicutes bacterium]|nr:helix-turn-helix domain-containing protein [Bacillota bacterium]
MDNWENTGFNEYEMIEKLIESSLYELSVLKENLKTQLPILRSNFLNNFIKGRIKSLEDITDKLKFLDLNLDFKAYNIVLLYIRKKKSSGLSGEDMIRISFLNIASAELIERCINRDYAGYAIEMENDKIALILDTGYLQNFYEGPREILTQLKNYLNDTILMDVAMGVSCQFYNMQEIGKAYEQAERALNYSIIKGKDITEFDELEQITDMYHFSVEQAVQLSNYLKIGDEKSIEVLLDSVYRENIIEKKLPPEKIKSLIFDIYNTVIKTLWDLNIEIGEDLPIEELLLKNNITVTFSKIKEKIASVCKIVKYEWENKTKRIINEILAFIDDNISDYNLNLETVADKFGKSSKYLSKIFKEETNSNFWDYVNYKRVELAKQYLKGQDISYAYKKAGFCSLSTFMRVFKKYTGITPGQYKEISK